MADGSVDSWWNSEYRYRQQIVVNAFEATLEQGSDVRTSIDTGMLEAAGMVRADRNDWRIAYYDAGGEAWTEIERDHVSGSETWFSIRNPVAAGLSDGNYYAYFGNPNETNVPASYSHSGETPSRHTVLDGSQEETVRGYYNGSCGWWYKIGVSATTDGGLSFVKSESNPVLESALPWEGSHVHGPFVIYHNGLYLMYYAGDWGGTPEIGLATSVDGTSFQRYRDGPVVSLGSGWESRNVSFPFVFFDSEEQDAGKRFKMLYAGSASGSGWPGSRIGYAYSSDGFEWTKHTGGPVLEGSSGEWDRNGVIPGSVVKAGEEFFLYYLGHDGGHMQTGLARAPNFEGPYVKDDRNPVICRRSSATRDLAEDLVRGSSTVRVPDSSVFSVGEPVWLHSPGGSAQLNRVARIDDPTSLTLADASSYDFRTGDNAYVRSWMYGSNQITTVYHDGTTWKAWATAFLALPDLLRETTAYATSGDGVSWNLDLQSSPPLTLGEAGSWDSASAENLRILDVPPRAPGRFRGAAGSTTAIDWSWSDTSDLEERFVVEDLEGRQIRTLPSDTSSWRETGLSPNTRCIRRARGSRAAGHNRVLPGDLTSQPSNECAVYTLAGVPGAPRIDSVSEDSLKVTIDTGGNPSWTEYAVREERTMKFVQRDGTLGRAPAWQRYSEWGGSAGVGVVGLGAGRAYRFTVTARNGDRIETAPSEAAAGETSKAAELYFAEGTCRPGFDSYICVMNPGAEDADVKVTYMRGNGASASDGFRVAGGSRHTVRVNDSLGSGDAAAYDFSCKVESTNGVGIIAERPMYFDYHGVTGGSVAMGAGATDTDLYFAEGTCRPGFDSYICVMNPGAEDADVKVTYMRGNGASASDGFRVAGGSRHTVRVNDSLGSGDAAAYDFSCKVESTNGVGIIAERPMYFDYHGVTGGSVAMGAR